MAGLQRFSLTDYVACNHLFGRRPSEGYLKPLFCGDFLRHHSCVTTLRPASAKISCWWPKPWRSGHDTAASAPPAMYIHIGQLHFPRLTRRDADAMVDGGPALPGPATRKIGCGGAGGVASASAKSGRRRQLRGHGRQYQGA